MNNNALDCKNELTQLLNEQSIKMTAVSEQLADIKNQITNGEIAKLNQLLEDQQLPFDDISKLEYRRQQLLSSYGFAGDKAGLEKCIQWCQPDEQIAQAKQTFDDSLHQLHHSIQTNSLLVSKGQNRIRRSLKVLTGQASATATSIYTSQGQTQESTTVHRSIAQV